MGYQAGPDTEIEAPAGPSREGAPPCPPFHRKSPAAMVGPNLLTLVGSVRRLAFDRSLPPSEALEQDPGRIPGTTTSGGAM